ncbi:MAG: caspase family protein [Leptospirales bacterium]|nr:caspase family protein [Leptospirales bacterium]
MYALIAVDSADSRIGSSVSKDMEMMSDFSRELAVSTGMWLNLKTLSGEELTETTFLETVQSLDPGPEDMVLFYFSGHGFRTRLTPTKWPMLYVPGSRGVDFAEVVKILENKNPRMILAFSDSCNYYSDSASRSVRMNLRALEQPSEETYRKLALQFRGRIYASSSKAGQFSAAQSDGGSFTLQFMRTFRAEAVKSDAAWDRIMEVATRPVSKQQEPQYELVPEGSPAETNINAPVRPIAPEERTSSINCDDLNGFLKRLRQLQPEAARANLQDKQQHERYGRIVTSLKMVGGMDDRLINLVQDVGEAYRLKKSPAFGRSFEDLVNYVISMQKRECQ